VAAVPLVVLHNQEQLGLANENSIIIDFFRLFPGFPIFPFCKRIANQKTLLEVFSFPLARRKSSLTNLFRPTRMS
jgi:hypothetical protein